MRNCISKILVFCLAAISAACSSASSQCPGDHNLNIYNAIQGYGKVYRVIDGDTYIINVNEKKVFNKFNETAVSHCNKQHLNDKYNAIKVRLFGIDTAESKHPDQDRNSAKGADTSIIVKNQIEGQLVEFTCFDYGYYGRAICSVSLGDTDIGEWLIRNGLSKYERDWGNHPLKELHNRYINAENK